MDRHVGARLRERRMMLGLTQNDLAQRVGITYQQLHKYEQAINRISAGRLYRCSQELNVPIDFFFEHMGGSTLRGPRHRLSLTLSRAFNEIAESHLQQALAELARMLAEPIDRGDQQNGS